MTSYLFSGTSRVTQQLDRIAKTFDAVSDERLDAIGVGSGWRCLEVGAGNGSVARLLARKVGPDGRVDATDVELADLAQVAGPNLVVRQHDITTDPLPDGEYDLVHARLLLMHLPDRREVLARLRSALRPGGWLLTEDYDVAPPPAPLATPDDATAVLYERVTTALSAVTDAAGVDRGSGRAAYAAFVEAGFVDVAARLYARSAPVGTPGRDLVPTYVAQLRGPMCATGLVSEADLDAFEALVRDPRFVPLTSPMVSTSGRRGSPPR